MVVPEAKLETRRGAVSRAELSEGAMAKSKAKKKSKFQTGSHGGCEARLYEFREKPISEEELKLLCNPLAPRAQLIAAVTFDEALAYLRFDSPDFDVHSVKCVGLIIMVSGSPLN
jgi:hypothetical protein